MVIAQSHHSKHNYPGRPAVGSYCFFNHDIEREEKRKLETTVYGAWDDHYKLSLTMSYMAYLSIVYTQVIICTVKSR